MKLGFITLNQPYSQKVTCVVSRCKELNVHFQLSHFPCSNIEVVPPVIGRWDAKMVFAVFTTMSLFWEGVSVCFSLSGCEYNKGAPHSVVSVSCV